MQNVYWKSLVALCLLTLETKADYKEALSNAERDNLPVVAFLGCQKKPVPGAWSCHAKHLEGFTGPCVVVSYPGGGHHFATYKVGEEIILPPAFPKDNRDDALDEVNAYRAGRGLRPFIRDEGLTIAARGCAAARARALCFGHTENDFAFVPSGTTATSAGCAAYPADHGWLSCCMDDPAIYGGAAWALGSDGKRYMHLFVR